MKKTALFLLIIISIPDLLIGQSDLSTRGPEGELVYENYLEDSTHIRVWNIGKTSLYRSGSSVGVHYQGAFGSLTYVIKEHNKETFLDLKNLDKIKDNYKVSIQCKDDVKVKNVMNEATVDWLNGIGVPARIIKKEKKIYVFSIEDRALLNQHEHVVNDGVLSKIDFVNGSLKIVGPYEVIITYLKETYIKEPVILDFELKIDDPIIDYQLSNAAGIVGIQKQLKKEYGILLQKEKRLVDVLTTKKLKK